MNRHIFTSSEFTGASAAPTIAMHERIARRTIKPAPCVSEPRTVGAEALGPAWQALGLSTEESASFLRILEKASRTRSHYELFLFLQSEIQRFIPHRILISAWGDYRSLDVSFDVISAMPGIRTAQLSARCVEPLVKNLFARWASNGRQPTLLGKGAWEPIILSDCEGCALHAAMPRMHSILVHGTHNARDNVDSLYLAFNPQSIINGHSVERFSLLADWLISEIDVAFQKVSPLTGMCASSPDGTAANPGSLSKRQQEVMRWLGEGRTNPEIAKILCVSPLTVKNHVQRIFGKLGARNRTEAVAKYRHVCLML